MVNSCHGWNAGIECDSSISHGCAPACTSELSHRLWKSTPKLSGTRCRCTVQDVFSLPPRADKTLQVVGFVFEESPQALQQAHDAAVQKAKQAADKSAKRGAGSAPPAPAPAGSAEPEGGLGKAGGEGEGAGAGAGGQAAGPQGEADDVRGEGGEGALGEGKGRGEHTQGGAHAPPAAGDSAADGSGGPSGASEGLAGAAAAAADNVEGEGGGGSDGIGAAPAPAKRVMGPAAPSAAMLAAAAAYMKELQEEDEEAEGAGEPGGGAGPRYEDDDELVGPVPPDLALEMDAVPQDDREAEVCVCVESGVRPLTLACRPAAGARQSSSPYAVRHQAFNALGIWTEACGCQGALRRKGNDALCSLAGGCVSMRKMGQLWWLLSFLPLHHPFSVFYWAALCIRGAGGACAGFCRNQAGAPPPPL